jgi:hypothetical protein
MAFLQPGRPQTEISGTLNRSKGKIYVKFVAILFEGKSASCAAQVTAMVRRKFAEKATKQSLEVVQTVRKGFLSG